MESRVLFTLVSLLLGVSGVLSFSIGRRQERSTDLADALAILQRQRRRVGGGNYVSSESLLDSRPLTLEDVNEWLSKTRSGHGSRDYRYVDPSWVSDGEFKDFDPRLSYNVPLDASPLLPQSVKATKQELNDIFNSDDGESNSSKLVHTISDQPEKKKKEEMIELKGDKKIIQKKSVDMDMSEALAVAAEKAEEDIDDNLSLDSLTKEEFKTLMKAVGKLQKQAMKLSEKFSSPDAEKVTVIETVQSEGPEKAVAVVQPASDEELKTVFEETVQPVVKETDIIIEGPQGTKNEKIVEEAVIPVSEPVSNKDIKEAEKELSSAIASQLESELEDVNKEIIQNEEIAKEAEDEILAKNLDALEHYWLVNKYMKKLEDKPTAMKRTTKRSANRAETIIREGESPEEELEDEQLEGNPPPISAFVAKIVALQGEVDKLKMVARLEDLENDVLTDALNEATLAQKEGSVSDVEFESLQQAIRIEEALQDIKNSEEKKLSTAVVKRGEPWKRRRLTEDDLPQYEGPKLSKNDVDRLLSEQYLIRDEGDDQETLPEVASLFLDNAEECPAVQSYSTNCELADLYALPVDNEARSLCNIHEMCYACGFSLGVSQDHCDFVYRAAATALCQNKENCVVESEIFLRTMKLKTRYVPHSQPDCRSTCTSKFLGMI
uniref:Uncharacterized protein n=1 Tax=Biomphalaria glabrata TaxID=6526 RepID=A0A2C9LGY9_BIOGL